MSGAEVVGIALAVPPLIVLAFDLFRDIQTLYQQVQVADETLLKVIGQIRNEESMFRSLIKSLLRIAVDIETQNRLLEPNSHKDWKDPNLENDIRICLGEHYEPANGYIKTIQCQLKSIHGVIHKEFPVQQPDSSVGGSHTSAMGPLLMSTVSVLGVAQRVRFRRKRSSVLRRFSLSTGKIKEIKAAHEILKEQNECLHRCLMLKFIEREDTNHKYRARGPQAGLTKSLDSQRSTNRTVEQQTTDELYKSLSKYHNCLCHSINLSLRTYTEVNQVQPNIPPSASTGVSGGVRYSILVTPGATHEKDTICLSVASSRQSGLNLKANVQESLCAAVYSASQRAQVDNFVMDSFILKTIPSKPGQFSTSGIQLKDVCQKLNMFDRHYLAALLARCAQVFHSSPWFALWDTRSIQFFDDIDKSKASEFWRPHLLPEFSKQVHTCNKLQTLGLILLELGGIDLVDYAPMEADGVKLALKQLTGKAGRPYKSAVECCFQGCGSLPNNGTTTELDFEKALDRILKLEQVGREVYQCMYTPQQIIFQT